MIEHWLSEHQVHFEVIPHETAYSAQKTAHAEHVSGNRFAKPVILTDDDHYYMLVLPASKRVSIAKAGKILGKPVHLATEVQMKELFGECELGAEPPFGSLYSMTTYMDKALVDVPFIVFRAESHSKSIKMGIKDYKMLEHPIVDDFTGSH